MQRAPLFLLYINVLVIATCGLIYELLAGTLASYLVGDSVTQFSTVIGVYLFAMGVGAWLSRFIKDRLARCFIEVELAVALIGGCSAPSLYLCFTQVHQFGIVLYGFVFTIGVLVGLELPLLMRILKDNLDFEELVSRVLAFDYIGALFASLAFPIILVPQLGLMRTSLLFGTLNASVGLWGTWLLRPLLKNNELAGLRGRAVLVVAMLVVGIIKADSLTGFVETSLYDGTVTYSKNSQYQRIVITKGGPSFQLFLNGTLQFNSMDEYRYHEALVHPALIDCVDEANVLVLGGGDGLAVREILKYDKVKSVTLVDLDPAMTSLADHYPPLKELTLNSLEQERVSVINADALIWIEENSTKFDAVVIDFPDPSTYSLGKLYTRRFYRLLRTHFKPTTRLSIQCSSPLSAGKSYWCIVRTMEAAGFFVHPYHASVPSFGVWGFALAGTEEFGHPTTIPNLLSDKLRYLNTSTLQSLFELPQDLGPQTVEINRLDNQILVRYHEAEWSRWN